MYLTAVFETSRRSHAANRGLWLVTVEGLAKRGYRVLLVTRDEYKARSSAGRLQSERFGHPGGGGGR